MDKKGTKAEGAFYVWEEAEIDEVLSTECAQWFKRHYGVNAAGNCTRSPRSDPMKEFTGKNVLFAAESVYETASAAGKSNIIASFCNCTEFGWIMTASMRYL